MYNILLGLCCVVFSHLLYYLSFLCLYTMIVTLLAKTQLYELTIIAAYGDMHNYYRSVVPKLLIIV